MATINELKWASLTATVNEIKSPNQFLKRLLWSNEEPKSTEDIEIGLISKGREIAPFVKKNGEGIMVAGYDETFQTVQPTNIRIKRPFTPSDLLYGRRPGTVIFSPGASMQMSAIRRHIATDMKVMADYITNAEEYLCSMALQGTVTYEVADQEVFTITYPKPSAHNVTLSVFWDDADLTLPRPLKDVHSVKRLINGEVGLSVSDAICGIEAADALLELVESGNMKMLGLEGQNVQAGQVTFVSQFDNDGVIFLGNIGGIRFWEYGRTALLNGVATSMIRPKYVEFVTRSAAAQRVMYYGAIPDMKALQGRLFQGRRFSKSWENEDPSVLMALTHSRPLPVPRRPGAMVSMKVVSG